MFALLLLFVCLSHVLLEEKQANGTIMFPLCMVVWSVLFVPPAVFSIHRPPILATHPAVSAILFLFVIVRISWTWARALFEALFFFFFRSFVGRALCFAFVVFPVRRVCGLCTF